MSFPLVAIGASAGGLEAVSELLAGIPPDSGLAFLVVQHLDPSSGSLLPELLSAITPLTTVQARDGAAVRPDHIYVIPPNATLTIRRGRIVIRPRESGPHHPVDQLFTSLALQHPERAIGIVLSGGDSDGAAGIQDIKEHGGITFAQDPAAASVPSMPRSAIDTGCVDFVLRPRDIAQQIARLSKHSYLRAPESVAAAQERLPPRETGDDQVLFARLLRHLRSTQGLNFTHYKQNTLRRRLARRMALHQMEDMAEYVDVVESDPAEAKALYRDFLIHVTGFFRDPEYFAALAQRGISALCEGRQWSEEPLRIWVPGCSSGEEVYTLAILLLERLGEQPNPATVQIFGTDICEETIEKARAGVYLDNIAHVISRERLERFFVRHNDRWRIGKLVRGLCTFARHDVTRDPPYSRIDLISCRNLLIYLDPIAQRRVMQTFHYALQPKGMLVLGPSESVGQSADLFEKTDQQLNFFRCIFAGPAHILPGAERAFAIGQRVRVADDDKALVPHWETAQRAADRLLLARYAPASVLVDESLNILQFRGETSPYLEHASGPPSLNLTRVARPELLVHITSAVDEARAAKNAVRRDGLRIDERESVSVEVLPLQLTASESCYVILFDDGARQPVRSRALRSASISAPESDKDRRLAQAESEISAVREYLQAAVLEHDLVKQELKSAHEEVLSTNEELQSTNEELETAKEELQSTNEELITANEELRSRNTDLTGLNKTIEAGRITAERALAYADIIIETVREPLVVLDKALRIVRANKAFYSAFEISGNDTPHRQLRDIGQGEWDTAELRAALNTVISRNEALDNFEVTTWSCNGAVRHLCLNARTIPGDDERGTLILLSVEDITERYESTVNLRTESRRKDEFLAMLAHELRNPLSPIVHTLHILRRTQSEPSAVKLFDIIERQTVRLVRLVDELLDVARINRGLIELKREPLDLGALIQHAADASLPRIEARQHELSLSLPQAPLIVDADPVRMEQVVSNILENAAKYTNTGGHIRLSLVADGGEAVISVLDDGIGIARKTLEHIFDLFAQVDHSPEHSGGGLGLGLTVVRRLLELHGGSIEARSAGLGQGSEFIARIPLLGAAAHALPAAELNRSITSAPGAGRRVLLVDDNTDSAESLAMLLREWGHDVVIANNGHEAIACSTRFLPEAAFIDIGMPGMNGYELARHLRSHDEAHDVRLVAITGFGQAGDRKAAFDAGFDAHFVKPAPPEKLQQFLRDLSHPSITP